MTLERALLYNYQETPWYNAKRSFLGDDGVENKKFFWVEQQIANAGGVPVFLRRREVRTKELITDLHGSPIDSLSGFEVLFRTDEFENAREVVETLGGTSFWTEHDADVVYRWPEHLKPQYLRRKIDVLPAHQVMDLEGRVNWEKLQEYEKEGKVFVKSMKKIPDKGFELVTMGSKEAMSHFRKYVRDKSLQWFIVSEPISLVRDCRGKGDEYRCFIANGKAVSISYHDKYALEKVPDGLMQAAQVFADDHKTILPWGYVLDVGITATGQAIIIELNSLSHSGRYRTNYFENFLQEFSPSFEMEKLQAALPSIMKERKDYEKGEGQYRQPFHHRV